MTNSSRKKSKSRKKNCSSYPPISSAILNSFNIKFMKTHFPSWIFPLSCKWALKLVILTPPRLKLRVVFFFYGKLQNRWPFTKLDIVVRLNFVYNLPTPKQQ